MMRRTSWAGMAAVALGLLAFASTGRAAEADHGKMTPEQEKCLQACLACAKECESCFDHCFRLTAEGSKHHAMTARTCADCGAICGLAAAVMQRKGPLAGPICEGCAKACDACGANCEKHGGDDPMMKRCADACKACAQACRDMINAAGPGAAPATR